MNDSSTATSPAKACTPPPPTLLNPVPETRADHGDTQKTADILVSTLGRFNVSVKVAGITPGPVVTRYELCPAPDVRAERIASLNTTLQMALEAESLRIVAPIPGRNTVGIELPNRRARPVTFREVVEGEAWRSDTLELPLALGKDAAGNDLVRDLTQTAPLLIAGAPGTGTDTCLDTILTGLLMSRAPDRLHLFLVDPTYLAFMRYDGLPHLHRPIANDAKDALVALRETLLEAERRRRILRRSGCRTFAEFNRRVFATTNDGGPAANGARAALPHIAVVVSEIADILLEAGKETYESVMPRLVAQSSVVGIHLILATTRPASGALTGIVKSDILNRIAFKVSQCNDSRAILDEIGAENLLGNGDMLVMEAGKRPVRAHCASINDDEVARVTACIKREM
jgi:S-DNA-T family DNA segregation ATPase FtsK/SpoIIIE